MARDAPILQGCAKQKTDGCVNDSARIERDCRSTKTKFSTRESATDDWILPEERRLLNTYSRLKPQQRSALLGFLESLE